MSAMGGKLPLASGISDRTVERRSQRHIPPERRSLMPSEPCLGSLQRAAQFRQILGRSLTHSSIPQLMSAMGRRLTAGLGGMLPLADATDNPSTDPLRIFFADTVTLRAYQADAARHLNGTFQPIAAVAL
jgi:hypothetical protein